MNTRTYRILLFLNLSIVYTMVFLQAIAMTVVANDIMDEMCLSPEQMGVLGSAYFYIYAAMILFSGLAAAWMGPRLTLSATFFLSGVGGLMFSNSHSFAIAFAGRGLTAVGMAVTMTSAFTLFNRWYPPQSFARLCSWFFAIGGLGAFAGTFFLPYLNHSWGWRGIFSFLSVLTLLFALSNWLVVRDRPRTETPEAGPLPANGGEQSFGNLWRGIISVARKSDFWRLCLWFACLTGSYFSLAGLWAIPYLEDVYGRTRAEAGAIVSMVAIGFIVGTPAISWLGDNVLKSYRLGLGLAGLFTFLGMTILITRIDQLPGTSLYLVLLCVGLTLNAPNVLGYAASRNLFGSHLSGVTAGALGCSAFLGGAFLQALCGALLTYARARHWPHAEAYALTFSPFVICGLAAALCGFTLSPKSFVKR